MKWPNRDHKNLRPKGMQSWADGLFAQMRPLSFDEWENSKCLYMGLVNQQTRETRVTLFGGN